MHFFHLAPTACERAEGGYNPAGHCFRRPQVRHRCRGVIQVCQISGDEICWFANCLWAMMQMAHFDPHFVEQFCRSTMFLAVTVRNTWVSWELACFHADDASISRDACSSTLNSHHFFFHVKPPLSTLTRYRLLHSHACDCYLTLRLTDCSSTLSEPCRRRQSSCWWPARPSSPSSRWRSINDGNSGCCCWVMGGFKFHQICDVAERLIV